MRADRLVSILMLLQSRGRVPARELSRRLEVSVRTIYRDMEALSAAGIPVYAERGANGGCCLVEDYRSDLTGLNADETRALLLLEAPSPLDSLEVGQKLKAALYKLYAALPRASQTQPRLHIDWSGWRRSHSAPESELLEQIYRAVTYSRRAQVRYRMINGMVVENTVEPLGLVAKGGIWYLVWQMHGKRRYFPAAELRTFQALEETFAYPADFDLAGYWGEVCAAVEAEAAAYPVRVRAQPEAAARLLGQTSGPLIGLPDQSPRSEEIRLAFDNLEEARARLLALGGAVEVLDPPELRDSLRDFAGQVLRANSSQNS